MSEFLYSSANILQLLNDQILRKTAGIRINVNATVGHLQTLLQVLEYTSVFMEFTANSFSTQLGKWIIITFFQVSRFVTLSFSVLCPGDLSRYFVLVTFVDTL